MEAKTKEGNEINIARGAAKSILSSLWRSIDFEKFNRKDIWGIFERKIKSAAVQNIYLPTFFEQAKRKLSIKELSSKIAENDLLEVMRYLNTDDKEVLKEIREHTSLCVLMVRLEQQQKRAEYEEKKALEAKEEEKDERQQKIQI